MKKAKLNESTARECRLLPVREFARVIGVSVWTARAWAYAGRIASVKVGSLLQVPCDEVDRLIAEGLRPRVHGTRDL